MAKKIQTKKKLAGVVAPFNVDNRVLSLYNKKYSDCLPQCFYGLKYTNLKNSERLQEIAEKNGGIHSQDVISMLDMAYNTTNEWQRIPGNMIDTLTIPKHKIKESVIFMDALYERLKEYLNVSEGILCFLESRRSVSNHYVILFKEVTNDIYIRDPQSNETSTIKSYLRKYKREYDNIYVLIDTYKTKTENPFFHNYRVTSDIIDEVFPTKNGPINQNYYYDDYDDPKNQA